MPDFVQDLPLQTLAIWCAALAVGATWAGIIFVKPFLRLLVGGEPNVNDSIAMATGMFSLFYGLLVSLLTVAAYQNLDRVESSVHAEAADVGRLYAAVTTYPEPLRTALRAGLRDYVLFTIHRDFPAHAAGRALLGSGHRLSVIRQQLSGFEPLTAGQEILHAGVMSSFQQFNEARLQRLAGVLVRLPNVLWYAVGVGAVINILLLVMLKMRPVQHMVLGGMTAFFLGVMLFVVIALDDPFRGANAVRPTAFQALWNTAMIFDEPL
jgi:hypothetical protein